jgi:hypothetical protein
MGDTVHVKPLASILQFLNHRDNLLDFLGVKSGRPKTFTYTRQHKH